VALLLASFVSVAYAENELVVIEDYVVGAEYEVIEVDGQPPERSKHGLFVTVVPTVLVTPGLHTLTLTLKRTEFGFMPSESENEVISITVANGARYRLIRENGKASIIELSERE